MTALRPLTLVLALLGALSALADDPWTHFDAEATPGLPGNEIQVIAPARAGGIWAGTLTGVTRWHDNAFHPVADAEGTPLSLETWTVLETDGGSTVIGHGNGVLTITANGTRSSALGGYTVAPIVQVKPGLLWAIAKERGQGQSHLFVFDGKTWAEHPGTGKLSIVDLFQAKSGKLWLAIEGNGLLEVDPEEELAEATAHLQGLAVTTIAEDGRGRIWAGMWDRGIAVYDGTGWEYYLKDEKGSAILTILQDAKGNMWVATSAHGLWRSPFNKQEWINDLAEEGAINTLAASRDGRVWVSSQMVGGLRAWDGEKWHVVLDSPLPIRAFHETDKAYWAGGVLDGLHRLPKK